MNPLRPACFPALRRLVPCCLAPCRLAPCRLALLLALAASAATAADNELTYRQYRDLARLADGFEHVAMFEPLQGEAGMFVAVAERFGNVMVFKADGKGVRAMWKSDQLAVRILGPLTSPRSMRARRASVLSRSEARSTTVV